MDAKYLQRLKITCEDLFHADVGRVGGHWPVWSAQGRPGHERKFSFWSSNRSYRNGAENLTCSQFGDVLLRLSNQNADSGTPSGLQLASMSIG